MSLEAILSRLEALTQPLPDIGHVYTMELSDVQPAEVQPFLGMPDQTQPRGWSIRAWQWFRRGAAYEHLDIGGYVTQVTHHVHLIGWWEVNYAHQSERDWRTMTETICNLFTDPLVLQDVANRFTAPTVAFEGRSVINDIYRCHDVEVHFDIFDILGTEEFDASTDFGT